MSNRFEEILDQFPQKRSRSRLEPFRGLVEELHRRRRPLREIALILAERFDLRISHVAIHDFLRATKEEKVLRMSSEADRDPVRHLPARPQPSTGESIDFYFEPSEPLRLRRSKGQAGG